MYNSSEHNLNQLVIYKKSISIFKLTRRISSYLTDDKDVFEMYHSKKQTDRYTDSLVMNALGLAPKIAEAESQNNPTLKLKYAKSIRHYIDVLYQDCLNLEKTKIHGVDFVQLLRKELKTFKSLHKHYVNSLL